MFSLGMFSFLAARMAVRKRGLELGSPPPMREAIVISRIRRVKTRPRFASVAAFLCLIVAHFECPDITRSFSLNPKLAPAASAAGRACGNPSARGPTPHCVETYGELKTPAERT